MKKDSWTKSKWAVDVGHVVIIGRLRDGNDVLSDYSGTLFNFSPCSPCFEGLPLEWNFRKRGRRKPGTSLYQLTFVMDFWRELVGLSLRRIWNDSIFGRACLLAFLYFLTHPQRKYHLFFPFRFITWTP